MKENINKGRQAKNLLPHHKYMMAFCWILPDELRLSVCTGDWENCDGRPRRKV